PWGDGLLFRRFEQMTRRVRHSPAPPFRLYQFPADRPRRACGRAAHGCSGDTPPGCARRSRIVRYFFDDCTLDTDGREWRRGAEPLSLEPQVFDLLVHLIRHRDRVVGKDELVAEIWQGRAVSGSALFNRINAARSAIGDSGDEQRLIRTLPRKGLRFVA